MKHLAKFAALAMACSLWSCSDDVPGVEPGAEEAKGDFFATVTLQLPTSMGSRSATEDGGNHPAQSTDGYEFGQDFENNIADIQVVLATQDATTKAYSFVTSAKGVPQQTSAGGQGDGQPTFLLQFQANELEQSLENPTEMHIFAFCNYTTTITATNFDGGNLKESLTGDGGTSGNPITNSISTPNNFLMTNASIPSETISAWSTLVKDNNTPEKAFDLGVVPVERVACRFDFQATGEGDNLNKYPIYPNGDNTKPAYANILLTDMALFNEEKDFYLLRHVSTTGTLDGAEICGKENKTNFVVSPDFALKNGFTGSTLSDGLASQFKFPLATIAQNANWTSLGTPNKPDNDGSSDEATPPTPPATSDPSVKYPAWPSNGTDYKIWRYATENTIPAANLQKNGITTGVVFRGEIKAISGATEGVAGALATAMENTETHPAEPIYAYRDGLSDGIHQNNKSNLNMIFGNAKAAWDYAKGTKSEIRDDIAKAVKKGIFTVYVKETEEGEEQKLEVSEATTDEVIFSDKVTKVVGAKTANDADLKSCNLVCYAPTIVNGNAHYYVYYYYFNRHNNNDKPSTMGPMEFATVRNNIYKLKVTTISAIGLPVDTPPDPGTPDEDPEVYFKVSVKVLDWVVRINNIEF